MSSSRSDHDSREDLAVADLGETHVVAVPRASDETPSGSNPLPLNEAIVGSTLGDFRLLQKLGEGAMGAVYKAHQISFDRPVALKILFGRIAENPHLVERLYREGRVLGHLDHPNIVQAYGIGEVAGSHFVAMEFIDGDNLQRWIRKLGRLSVPDALAITLAVAQALDYAHDQNIVHRDLKPENILITRRGELKVADFGMVKIDDDELSLTQTGHALGTPWYMPLEQAKNAKDIDGRSDLYALGCMLYCLLTGEPPFGGRTLADVLFAKEVGTFPPARSKNPSVPERLELVLMKMMAKLPKHRYATAADLIRDLDSLGLAGKRLSFLGRSSNGNGTATSPASGQTIAEAPSFDPHVWYLRMGSAVNKFSTEQVQAMVASGRIAPTTPASHFAKRDFRALSAYREFAEAQIKATRAAVDRNASSHRHLYEQIEAREKAKELVRQVETSQATYWAETIFHLVKYPLAGLVFLFFLYWVVTSIWR